MMAVESCEAVRRYRLFLDQLFCQSLAYENLNVSVGLTEHSILS
jgi:hypothetical protein